MFRRELGRYVLAAEVGVDGELSGKTVQPKRVDPVAQTLKGKAVVEPCSHAKPRDDRDSPTRSVEMGGSGRELNSGHAPVVVQRYSYSGADASIPFPRDAMCQTDGLLMDKGRTEGSRRARSPKRRLGTNMKWVKTQSTEELRVDHGIGS